MLLQKILKSVVLTTCVMTANISAQAAPAGDSGNARTSVSISNNSGGTIVAYALAAADYRSAGTLVKFTGRCDSACTLFLGLPASQTCISQGAFFRFHAPFGVSAQAQRTAQAYLMRKYPGWVRGWIARNHGLSSQLMTMDYSYASKFIRSCDAVASR